MADGPMADGTGPGSTGPGEPERANQPGENIDSP
jgi:hypothetical protein